MTKAELEKYREQLLHLSRRLGGEIADVGQEALRQTGGTLRGNLSNIPTHPADLASDNYEHETAVGLLEHQDQILEQTAAALERIEEGTFGKCQECGKAIPVQRLDAVPYTPYCVDCARKLQAQTPGSSPKP